MKHIRMQVPNDQDTAGEARNPVFRSFVEGRKLEEKKANLRPMAERGY